jgi:ATP-dependent RNA/DNA helicase IGHMBP2
MIKIFNDKVCKILNTQYRMNETIMNFSNKELYEGKLIAADEVKSGKPVELVKYLEIGESDNLKILDKNLISIDTNNLEFYECIDIDSESKYNKGEALICKFLINYFKTNKLEFEHIGIITPYSAQVNHLRNLMPLDEFKSLEISTVDGFQGREKEIIILSLVRSNKKHEVGFLVDQRRMNVAITRAKKMVVLIADFSTISKNNFLKRMSDYFTLNSYTLDILDNIMDYKEIEEIQFSNIQDNKKEDRKDDINKKNEKKKQKKIKKNFEKEEKQIKEDIKPIIKNEGSKQCKKEELDISFIKKIQSLIENFINSQEVEFKIEGLSNIERKYIHNYSQTKNLIHESHVNILLK